MRKRVNWVLFKSLYKSLLCLSCINQYVALVKKKDSLTIPPWSIIYRLPCGPVIVILAENLWVRPLWAQMVLWVEFFPTDSALANVE